MSSPTNAPRLPASDLARAYDVLAPDYDARLEPARWVRERLWARMDLLFPAGARVLDVTAGTGADALHLAARGVGVVAADLAPGMLAQLRAKDPTLETRVADFNDLPWSDEPFDGLISTFAGLNTSPDLRSFAQGAARLLRPGGVLFVHLLNRWPALELARQAARLRWREAWRNFSQPVRLVTLGKTSVPHFRHAPLDLYRRVFAPHFRLGRVEAQGLLRPVGPGWGAGLERWERAIAHRPFCHSLGTFFSLEMHRR